MSSLQKLVSVGRLEDARLCVHRAGLDVHHHRGVFLAVLELAMHLTPGAPHAEAGSGDVLAVRTLSASNRAGECLIPTPLHLHHRHLRLISSVLP